MSDLGDLGPMMREGSVPDHGWLEVDEDVYHQQSRLPIQNLDFRQDLERLWGDRPSFLMSTDGVDQGRYMDAVTLETTGGRAAAGVPPEGVERLARLLMSSGVQGREVVARLAQRLPRETIVAAAPLLKKLATREGHLLGVVYLAAADFPRCTQGEIQKARPRLAGVSCMIRKEACASCVFGSEGKCSNAGGLALVASVPWSKRLADHYQAHLASSRRAAVVPPEKETPEGWRIAIQRAISARPVAEAPKDARPRHQAVKLMPVPTDPRDSDSVSRIKDTPVRCEEVLSSKQMAALVQDVEKVAAKRGVALQTLPGWKKASKAVADLRREAEGVGLGGDVADWAGPLGRGERLASKPDISPDVLPKASKAERVAVAPERVPRPRSGVTQLVREILSTGVLGRDLKAHFQRRVSHLLSTPEAKKEAREAMAEMGALGHAYVDPTLYSDYGVCKVGSQAHRTSAVPYVLEGVRCASCVRRTGDSCSLYRKTVVAQVPEDRLETIRAAALSSVQEAKATRVASVLSEFQVGGEMVVEVDEPRTPEAGPDVRLNGEWQIP